MGATILDIQQGKGGLPGADRFLARGPLKRLRKLLGAEAVLEGIVRGRVDGKECLAVATADGIIVLRVHGRKKPLLDARYDQTTVTEHRGHRHSTLRIAHGGEEFLLDEVHRDQAQAFASYAEERRVGRASEPSPPALDDEKRARLERMLEKGSITRAEYDRILTRAQQATDRPVLERQSDADGEALATERL